MSYLETVLMRDEQIIYAGRLHWIIYVPSLMFILFGWVLAEIGPSSFLQHYAGMALPHRYLAPLLNYLVLGIVVAGVLMLLEAYLRAGRTELVVTNRRVLAKFGIISRQTVELFLSKVEGAYIEQGILGRMLNFGSVHVKGTGSGMTPIDSISYPEFFQRALLEQIRQRQMRDEDKPGNHD